LSTQGGGNDGGGTGGDGGDGGDGGGRDPLHFPLAAAAVEATATTASS